ncbi:aminoacyl-tRNA deacylase and HDOD domain-containing protein [Thiopseudomonas acetoxidans]|uniref:HDOD domain-containing protein n=1 Tax=Thiopseudomonas acetoxidans TaxID=3041622 RepID=A0ABT7SKJ4_9GAMM|nr:HDOD domain-containing protein [Thiopseudomonas sp. CY1220]MDM7856703.1 HDOD domain-containing protein [Thiopseudomonas sp. CY1220]
MSLSDFSTSQPSISSEQVAWLLKQQNIPVETQSAQLTPAQQQLQVVVLRDAEQYLCAIFARNHILDLRALNTQLNANYKADSKHSSSLKVRLQVHDLPAIPDLLNLPCVYATHLTELDDVLFESGSAGSLLKISADSFSQLMKNSQALAFTAELPATNPNLLPSNLDVQHIKQAVQSLTTLRIKQRLEETLEIPPLSVTAQKVLRLRTDPNAYVDELTAIVETDPAMAAQVMSWAASPYYAAPGKVRSIEDAIIRVLGFDLVINLALGLALGKTLKLPSQNASQNRDYWQQAIYTASLIEGLVVAIPRQYRPEAGLAYLAGLLHSFGYVLLAHIFPSYFSLISQYLAANPHLQACYVEHFLLGITREQMGAWLMQHWQMPEELTVAIRQQHNPDYQGPYAVYSQLTYLATQLLAAQEGVTQDIPASLYESLHLTPTDAQQALDKVTAAEQALRLLAAQLSS